MSLRYRFRPSGWTHPKWSGEGASAVFSDGFESGDLTHSENGYSWVGFAPDDDGGRAGVVQNEQTHAGSYSAVIEFPAQSDGADASPQGNLSMPEMKEIWVEYWLYVPSNYNHRAQSGPTNNKFFGLWRSGARSDVHMIPETEKVNVVTEPDTDQEESYLDWVKSDPDDPGHEIILDPFITTQDHGSWIQCRWHVRLGDMDTDNGVLEFWKNGSLAFSRNDLVHFYTDTGDAANNVMSHMRLMGWANSGYDEVTSFYFDDIAIYESDPGW